MRGGDWRDFGGIARSGRRPARAFRPGWIANELEARLVPATLTLSPTTLPDDTLGHAYSQIISATGGTAPYTFAVSTGTLPGGLTLDPSTGAITGTPTSAGASSFTITATDNASDSGNQAYSVTINPALTFTTTTLPGATINTAYSQQLATSGGTGTPTFAVTTGTLPTGLTLSPAGLLSGTPTTGGSSTFTVTATDTAGATANQQYTLDVASSAATTGPTVTSLQRFGFHAQPTIFKLTFSTALDPTSAQDVSNYTLVPFNNGTAGTPIALSSATYDATTNTVTLTPAHNVYLYAQYQLTVKGTSPSGVKDTAGNFLAGANGQSGTNYVKTFGKEILAGPNIPSSTPTAVAAFINNEWNNELASHFAALAAAAGDTTTTATSAATVPATSAIAQASHSAPAVAVPATIALAPSDAPLASAGDVLGAIVLPDQDKKK